MYVCLCVYWNTFKIFSLTLPFANPSFHQEVFELQFSTALDAWWTKICSASCFSPPQIWNTYSTINFKINFLVDIAVLAVYLSRNVFLLVFRFFLKVFMHIYHDHIGEAFWRKLRFLQVCILMKYAKMLCNMLTMHVNMREVFHKLRKNQTQNIYFHIGTQKQLRCLQGIDQKWIRS